MDLYAENILEHFHHPRGRQTLPWPTVEHEEVNASCGDSLTIQLRIQDGKIAGIGWSGTGCAISQAGMSLLWEDLQGKNFDAIEKLRKENIYDLLGVPVGPRRVKCALLCLHTLRNALRKAKGEAMQGWLERVEE